MTQWTDCQWVNAGVCLNTKTTMTCYMTNDISFSETKHFTFSVERLEDTDFTSLVCLGCLFHHFIHSHTWGNLWSEDLQIFGFETSLPIMTSLSMTLLSFQCERLAHCLYMFSCKWTPLMNECDAASQRGKKTATWCFLRHSCPHRHRVDKYL